MLLRALISALTDLPERATVQQGAVEHVARSLEADVTVLTVDGRVLAAAGSPVDAGLLARLPPDGSPIVRDGESLVLAEVA